MLTVGLTGGIGSGKSAAAFCFQELGVPVIDADEIAHNLMSPDSVVEQEIIDTFGSGILSSNGHIDRTLLRQAAFSDLARKKQLEQIIHPKVYRQIREELENLSAPYCIVMIPLLVETGQTGLFDKVLVIDVPVSIQIERTMARSGLDEATIRNIISMQVDRKARLAYADDVIDNSGSLEQLQHQVEKLHQRYLAQSSSGAD